MRLPGKIAIEAAVSLVVTGILAAGTIQVEWNGLQFSIDAQSGGLVRVAMPLTGVILEAGPESAGLVDVAYPHESFAALRLDTRHSRARVTNGAGGITITWDSLGPSRNQVPIPGNVFAEVTLHPVSDHRSVNMQCRIVNRSRLPIPQVLFPDLHGFQAFDGPERTELRLAGTVLRPFAKPLRDPDSAPFYVGRGWQEFQPGAYAAGTNALRWLDYGSLVGGLSVFERKWATDDPPGLFTQRAEANPDSLRLAWESRHSIAPGESWTSGEFWLTPHAGGWAKGIEVFRQYVREVDPPRTLPRHIREGLGFRTFWEIQVAEPDPNHAAFRYRDIPRIAKDAQEHGIDEIMSWGWAIPSSMPVRLHPELGTLQELLDGVRAAKAMGVHFAPFVSLVTLRNALAAHYGAPTGTSDWTYHPELVPNFRPYYSRFWDGAHVPTDNPEWQRDVTAALTEWIDRGISSFGWDEFLPMIHGRGEPKLIAMIRKIRATARARDPESTFAAEVVHASNLEFDGAVLDYSWNWSDYADIAPLTNVLRAPRLNCNIEDSPRAVKKAFCDNLFLNVMPKKPDQPNGTALISDYPELSAALKEVARLRRRFLPYFTDGVFLGGAMLSEPSAGFVRGYQLGNKLLIAALNDGDQARALSVQSDLRIWLPSAIYHIRYIDSSGSVVRTAEGTVSRWSATTRVLKPLELAFFEISGAGDAGTARR